MDVCMVDVWMCGGVVAWMCVCVDVWVCGGVVAWMCVCVGCADMRDVWICGMCGCVDVWLCGSVDVWMCGMCGCVDVCICGMCGMCGCVEVFGFIGHTRLRVDQSESCIVLLYKGTLNCYCTIIPSRAEISRFYPNKYLQVSCLKSYFRVQYTLMYFSWSSRVPYTLMYCSCYCLVGNFHGTTKPGFPKC